MVAVSLLSHNFVVRHVVIPDCRNLKTGAQNGVRLKQNFMKIGQLIQNMKQAHSIYSNVTPCLLLTLRTVRYIKKRQRL
jgi:hypothetical protein